MSERIFDDLARALASPMPRRRAVRMVGAALAVAALPGLRPRSALARSSITCDPNTEELCSKNAGTQVCMPLGGTCCIFGPESGYDGGLLVGCGKGARCGSGKLGDRCVCDQHWDAEGNCVECDEADKCGKNCCKKGQYCASPKKGLCCKEGATYCTVIAGSGSGSGGGKATCCPEGTKCCANDKRSDCCRPGQQCRAGRCTCPDGTQSCGGTCCKTGERCSNGKCCPKDRVNCGDDFCCGAKGSSCSKGKCCPKGKVNCGGGGRCCAKVDCCGKTCCEGASVCANVQRQAPRLRWGHW